MQFDIASFAIGCVVGLVAAAMMKLNALKDLSLKLNQIGVDLGISGFEPKNGSTQTIGPVSGTGNEVNQAGRDINKTSNLYKTVQAALQEASGGSSTGVRIARTERVQLKKDDPQFAKRLEDIRKSNSEEWFPLWIEACLADPELKRQLDATIQRLRNDGWVPRVIGCDNIPGGLHVNLDVERDYQ